MPSNPITRRDILRTLAIGGVGGSVLQVIPLEAAEQVHRMVKQEKIQAPAGKYRPKFFPAHQYATLSALCDAIIPGDESSAGAAQAGAPEFIDLLTSENKDYQVKLGGGLMWLDSFCIDRHGSAYLSCSAAQQTETLDLIAYRRNAEKDESLSQGIEFFAFLRRLTTDGFYSSEIGIKDLQYIGNTFLKEFPGCPPIPET
ncbi:MAG TPA: gluconate 2-dehydrogenase subunit 3 family protein [Terriglobales bacterium]|jgi:gluconate 2-dehydrogenase gamma chain|nr:gluconate 2-dehydrogenase subunit 3 family protein [Terriglobales bacterium]